MPRRRARPAIRLLALLGVMVLALVAVSARLVQLQVVKAPEFEQLGSKQRIRRLELPATRGAVTDRNRVPLALSIEARSLYADPRAVGDPRIAAKAIAPLLRMPVRDLVRKMRRKTSFVYLARKVDLSVANRVLALGLPGIGALREIRRVYPAGPLGGQIVGFVGTDNVGLAGLEYAHDAWLRGTPGEQTVEVDPRGREIPQGRNDIRAPEPGGGIVLTIDREIQYAAERVLEQSVERTRARNGVAIVLNPKNGEVLAMANWPPMNPARFAEVPPFERRNRAVTDSYEPGSVNKVITAAAAIEAGLVEPAQRFTVPDQLRVGPKVFSDYESHPTERLTFTEILARSSNVGTIKVAVKIGARRVQGMLERFGLGRATGVGFPGEADGIMLPLDQWWGTSIGTIPIGQGIAVTPLQMAMAYAAIANDGVWVTPRLVRAKLDPRTNREIAIAPGSRRRVVSAYTAAQLRAMLVAVVEEGTGRNARIPGYLVGGKTGTARKPLPDRRGYSNEIVTTFAGLVPAEAPRLVVLVALDNPRPRYAALTAAPAFREIAQFALAHLAITPSLPDDPRIGATLRVGG